MRGMSHELSWPYGLLSSAKILLQAAPNKVRGILVDVHGCGLADGVCSMLYTQKVWIKLPWSADLAWLEVGAISAVIFRQELLIEICPEQVLLPNEGVSSQSCDMDEGGLASMPGLFTKIYKI